MWKRLILLSAMLMLGGSAHSAQNGFGAAPAPVHERQAQGFEPWTKNAKVGDFVDRKYHPSGQVERSEVTEVTAEYVIVLTSSAPKSKDGGYTVKYQRVDDAKNPAPAKAFIYSEVDMKKAGTQQKKIGGQTVECELWEGFIKSVTFSSRDIELYKKCKCQKIVGKGVPLDGIVKLLKAKDDGKNMTIDSKTRSGPVVNTIETTDLLYEVVDFGNTQQKK